MKIQEQELMGELGRLCEATEYGHPDGRRQHIIGLLEERGIPFRVEEYPGRRPVNILIEFGKNPHRFIVGGHYDTIGDTVGANDNGMGVLALIHLAEKLRDTGFTGDLTIALFDLEENLAGGGLYEDMGSYCLIEKREQEEKVALRTLILDVIGVGDTPYISTRGTLYEDEKVFEHLTTWTKSIPPSDNLCFMEAGWSVWLLCSAWEQEVRGGYPETYCRFHSSEDTPYQEGISPGMVLEIVERVRVLVGDWNMTRQST